jgi:hypothetical protein
LCSAGINGTWLENWCCGITMGFTKFVTIAFLIQDNIWGDVRCVRYTLHWTGWRRCNAQDPHSGSVWFESRLDSGYHDRSCLRVFVVFLSAAGKCRYNISIRSRLLPSKSFPIHYHKSFIRRYMIRYWQCHKIVHI